MDLPGLTSVRVAHSRADLALGNGVAPMGGGTWLYSEGRAVTTAAGLGGPDGPNDVQERFVAPRGRIR